MKLPTLSIIPFLLFTNTLAHGATISVGSGESIQTAVDGAADGDEIVLTYPGQYLGNVIVSGKALTIRAVDSEYTNILGNFTIVNHPASSVSSLKSFTMSGSLQSSGSGELRVLGMKIDTDFNASGLNKVFFENSTVQKVTSDGTLYFSGSTVEALSLKNSPKLVLQNTVVNTTADFINVTVCIIRKSTIKGNLNFPDSQDQQGNPTKLVFLQGSNQGQLTSNASRTWLGYSNLRRTKLSGIVEVVGNRISGYSQGGIGIDLNGTQTIANIHNNYITDFRRASSSNLSNQCIGIRIRGDAKAEIINNLIKNNCEYRSGGTNTKVGIGILVESTSGTRILGNLLKDNYSIGGSQGGHANIWAPAQNVTIAYNGMTSAGGSELVAGGATNLAFTNDASFEDRFMQSDWGRFMRGKLGQDKGPPDAIYQDRDGSRNDIGPHGGRNYLINGTTTNGPIPISFTADPLAVPVGGTVTIESTGATVK